MLYLFQMTQHHFIIILLSTNIVFLPMIKVEFGAFVSCVGQFLSYQYVHLIMYVGMNTCSQNLTRKRQRAMTIVKKKNSTVVANNG